MGRAVTAFQTLRGVAAEGITGKNSGSMELNRPHDHICRIARELKCRLYTLSPPLRSFRLSDRAR